jgi:5-methylcytosine-specific restriction endonuclease McrBC GTP-binding regulatory subunit McrB
MPKTLLLKFTKESINDYTPNSISYIDPSQTRWNGGAYSKISEGDYIIFTARDKIIIGQISEIKPYDRITCNNYKEHKISLSELFQIDAFYPELVAAANRNFPPFIHPVDIDIKKLHEEIENKEFIYYHAGFDRKDFIISWINPNDRILLLNEEFKFLELYKRTIGGLIKLDFGADYFNVKGYDIDKLIEIQKSRNKNRLQKNLTELKEELRKHNHYLFKSFSNYYDSVHNKGAYKDLVSKTAPPVENKYNVQYYCVGFKWNGSDDQLGRFKKDSIWENGYDDKYLDKVKGVKIGSKIAAKTSYVEQKSISILHIHALGVVKANPKNGKKLVVEWQKDFKPFKIKDTSYRDTITQVKNRKNIKSIFYQHRTALQDPVDNTTDKNMDTINPNIPLNQILFGPPGTGKTYNTINKALEICGIDIPNDRNEAKAIFDKKVEKGQIAFITFHQSMSYEDFVEGIKPQEPNDDGGIFYKIEKGIFRELCERAQKITTKTIKSDNEISTLTPEVFKALYYNLSSQLPDQNDSSSPFELKTKNGSPFYLFKNSRNSIVVNTQSMKNRMPVAHVHAEKVLFEDAKPHYTSYVQIIIDRILEDFSYEETQEDNSTKPFILIIDEINRGNVSEIFGELITLIETDKRLGRAEQISLKLPYSKKAFGVPENVYIIGTMNTADKSVEALDSALRRRFSFEEVPPIPKLVAPNRMYLRLLWKYKEVGWDDETFKAKENKLLKLLGGTNKLSAEKYDIWDNMIINEDFENPEIYASTYFNRVNLENILTIINKRIHKLLDKDHLIGHSYFIKVSSIADLMNAFYKKIIPLLQEYFYGDFGKIGLILGNGFVMLNDEDDNILANFDVYEANRLEDKKVFSIIDYRLFKEDEKESKFLEALQNLIA